MATVDYEFGPVASLVFGAAGIADEAGGLRPPSASAAPMPRRKLSPGTGSRLWAPDVISASSNMVFSPYVSLPLSLSLFDKHFSFFLLYCPQQ